jgi:hypothetical protein
MSQNQVIHCLIISLPRELLHSPASTSLHHCYLISDPLDTWVQSLHLLPFPFSITLSLALPFPFCVLHRQSLGTWPQLTHCPCPLVPKAPIAENSRASCLKGATGNGVAEAKGSKNKKNLFVWLEEGWEGERNIRDWGMESEVDTLRYTSSQTAWVQPSVPTLTSYMALGRSLTLTMPQFPLLQMGVNIAPTS